ncbi:chloramphenicol acetyltransferase [Agromyces atrinae]|uniref:CatA-like O-acetyltransferase n=1 Tax=Agromyces atrinae TaxID=592376 RepID=UPI001F56D6DC|nr:CatA-like O-acetyltransferase [Agromyces atrinae]MCI2958458.1 chloramphenicol acetyltransferase [Agromyces atrinae]
MTEPRPIDLDSWRRRELFEHYRASPCTYALTVEIDVTEFVAELARVGRKTYVAQIWAIATIINRHDEFRMTLDDEGRPSVWPVVHPAFTVFNAERETFACVWAPYDDDFAAFHDVAAPLLAEHAHATELFPLGAPSNMFDVSSLPWVSFTGFTLAIRNGWDHLAPIITLGRYVERDGRVVLPLAFQIHHAAADGFHASRFVSELQQLVAEPGWLTPSY